MEREKSWLTSGAFAELCGTTKETLRHYKDMGLLLPAHRGDNNYSYYDVEQFYDFYAISIFRQTGTPLEEIGRCLERQSVSETAAKTGTYGFCDIQRPAQSKVTVRIGSDSKDCLV